MGFDMRKSLAPGLVLLATASGCIQAGTGEPVDYGAPTTSAAITTEVIKTVRDSDPSQTKVGAYGRFLTTHNIGGGTLRSLAANTSQEVTSRTVNGNIATLQILEKTSEYRSNSPTPEKMSRNFILNWEIPSESTSPAGVQPQLTPASSGVTTAAMRSALRSYLSKTDDSDGGIKVTFHRLRAWEDSGPPPERVRSQPNCLGLPQCQIRLRHVLFDLVSWDVPEGNRVHIELVVSPDVPQTIGLNMNPIWPYIPGLVRSCITRLVPIGDEGRSKTLVEECKDVVNFAFDSSPGFDDSVN